MEEIFLQFVSSPNFVMMTGVALGVIVWWVLSNWNKLKLPYEWLMAWYNKRKKRDDILQMILDDHKNSIEMKDELRCQQESIKIFTDNQNIYHEQSIDIRNDLNNNLNKLAENFVAMQEADKKRDTQIDALMSANRVLLGEEINAKFKQYISLNGIPEDELDEFSALHDTYKSLGGNHTGDAKYKYVIDNLKIIPVSTRLVYDTDEKE